MIKGRFIIHLLFMAAILALQPAPAATPAETSTAQPAGPSAQTLGILEGALNYCAPIDPASADRLRGLIKQLTDGADDEQLAKLRQSDAYRGTYDSVMEFTSKIAPPNAKKFCASAGLGDK
jgi:hypothetical protein